VAQLKVPLAVVRCTHTARFHGENAVAQLKDRPSLRVHPSLLSVSTEKMPRGPIEGVRLVLHLPAPAVFPRRKCRGPIEACRQQSKLSPEFRVNRSEMSKDVEHYNADSETWRLGEVNGSEMPKERVGYSTRHAKLQQ
jgi:hypothetical protein